MKKMIMIAALYLCLAFPMISVAGMHQIQQVSLVQTLSEQIQNQASLSKISDVLHKIEDRLNDEEITYAQTVEYIQVLSQAQDYALDYRDVHELQLSDLQQQIDALGVVPEGQTEPIDITKKREMLQQQADIYKIQIADADLNMAYIDVLNGRISKLRADILRASLMKRHKSIIHPATFISAFVGLSGFVVDMIRSPWVWYYSLETAQQFQFIHQISVVGLILGGLCLIVGLGSVYIRRRFGYDEAIENPSYMRKVSTAVWVFVSRGLLPSVVLGAMIVWIHMNELLYQTPFGWILQYGAFYCLITLLSCAGLRSILTPKKDGKWRLISISDEKAKSICRTAGWVVFFVCFCEFLQQVGHKMVVHEEIDITINVLSNLIKAICIILVIRRLLSHADDNVASGNADENNDVEEHVSNSFKIGTLIALGMIAVFVMSLFGYVRLSEFILNRFIFSVIFCAVLYILYQIIRGAVHYVCGMKFWRKSLHIPRKMMSKIEFLFGLFSVPIVIVFGVFVLLGIWGVSVDILLQNAKKLLTGFYIGNMKVSLNSIFIGCLSFFGTLFAFRLLKKSLQNGGLSKLDIDLGVRQSVIAGIGFVGVITASLVALTVMGGSLKGLALIAGALSFGAGLGLQNVVNNFVSGVILLFERPIKIGDWVIINGQEGIVKRINIRSTSLETWTKSDVIIPNADVLSSSLINLTHDSRMGRVDIAVGVSYGADIELVKKVLSEIPLENKKVLKTPQPFVLFTNLGESSLDFQMSCYTSDIMNRAGIATDLRERIINKFRELNIEIPFPQRDIHIINEIKSKK